MGRKSKIKIVKEFERLTFRPMKNVVNRSRKELENVLRFQKKIMKKII